MGLVVIHGFARADAVRPLPTRGPPALKARRRQTPAGDEHKPDREQDPRAADQPGGEAPAEIPLRERGEGGEREPYECQDPGEATKVVARRRPTRITRE